MKRYRIGLALGIGLAIAHLLPGMPEAAAAEPSVSATVSGAPEVVYDWQQDRCDRAMAPDEPARAFRNGHGAVYLLATDDRNWSMSGPSLGAVKRHCNSVFHAGGKPEPGSFDNDGWIEGIYTANGRDVLALISNDWAASRGDAADRAAAGCADRGVAACDYMSITMAESSDGGNGFTYSGGDHLLAALPFDVFTAAHGTAGFAVTSNLFKIGDEVYVFLGKRSQLPGQAGSCLFRSRQPFDPASWGFWISNGFMADPAESRKQASADGLGSGCLPVSVPFPQPVELRSVGLLPACHCAIAVFEGARKVADGQVENGFFITASADLVSWSKPVLVMRRPFDAECRDTLVYPSLLDPAATDRNFSTITANPYLYFTRMNRTSCKGTADRDLVRVPITLKVLG